MGDIVLSSLCHTWILDLDGTLFKHNGYKEDGCDTILDGADRFLNSIPKGDTVVIITSRSNDYRQQTEKFLVENHIRYDHIICGVPYGERILVNDRKPSGLNTAVAVNVERDCPCEIRIKIDETL